MQLRRVFSIAAVVASAAAACEPNIDLGEGSASVTAVATASTGSDTVAMSSTAVGTDTVTSSTGLACDTQRSTLDPTLGAIAVANDQLFVVSEAPIWPNGTASIVRVPLDGGALAGVADEIPVPLAMVADATNVYWADGAAISKAPVGGGAPVMLALTPDFGTSIALHGTDVVYGNANAAKIQRVPIAGGSVKTVYDGGDGEIDGIATDADYVYFTSGGATANASVLRADFADGKGDVLVDGMGAGGIAVDASYVYWVDPGGSANPDAGLWRVSLDGSSGAEQLDATNPLAVAIAIDDANIYWGGGTFNSTTQEKVTAPIDALAKSGGATTVIAASALLLGPSIAACPNGVCWSDAAASQLDRYVCPTE